MYCGPRPVLSRLHSYIPSSCHLCQSVSRAGARKEARFVESYVPSFSSFISPAASSSWAPCLSASPPPTLSLSPSREIRVPPPFLQGYGERGMGYNVRSIWRYSAYETHPTLALSRQPLFFSPPLFPHRHNITLCYGRPDSHDQEYPFHRCYSRTLIPHYRQRQGLLSSTALVRLVSDHPQCPMPDATQAATASAAPRSRLHAPVSERQKVRGRGKKEEGEGSFTDMRE